MGAPSSPVMRSGTGDEGALITFSHAPPKWEKLDPGLLRVPRKQIQLIAKP